MPEGITILSEKIQAPANVGPLVFFLTALGLTLLVASIFLIKDAITDEAGISAVIVSIIFILIVAGIIMGIIALLQSREHVYKLLLSDDFPATKLFEMFKVRDVDGLIYTVLPLE